MKLFMMNAVRTILLLVLAALSLQALAAKTSSNGVSSIQASDEAPSSIFSNGFESIPSPPAITGFSASVSSVTVGESTTLAWSTENASSCTPSNGTGGWNSLDINVPTGNAQVEISAEGTHEFDLTCFGALGQVDSTVSVTATSPAPSCDVGLTTSTIKEWNIFFGTPWPGPSARETRVRVPEFGYYAVRFDTGNVEDIGAVATFEASATKGQRIISISEIPGCFDVAPECKAEGRDYAIGWNTTGSGGDCRLKPNTSYYWNVTFTDGYNPSSSSCQGTFCLTFLWVANSDYK